ncbi:MAG: hypothetical protein B7Z54_01505 [Sphingobacteriales bacterium 12-47-4]|nr:MAG: hypothetical protein B7Z54_01505 [Sphingobacteriales bacterium 12-47-4]
MTGLQLIKKMEAISLQSEAEAAINQTGELGADIIAGQLAQGQRADGTEITPFYKPSTIEIKRRKSGLAGITDRVTLYDTGSYYRGLYVTAKGGNVFYGSRDSKANKLQDKYGNRGGKGLLGFNRDGKSEYTPILKKAFIANVKNRLK